MIAINYFVRQKLVLLNLYRIILPSELEIIFKQGREL